MKDYLLKKWITAMSYAELRELVKDCHKDITISYNPGKAPIKPEKPAKAGDAAKTRKSGVVGVQGVFCD